MTQIMWKSLLMKLMNKEHLNADEAEWFVDDLMKGNANPAIVGAVLATQQLNGLTAPEVAGASRAMVAHAVPLSIDTEATDIVGTGGDGAHTVNLSTMGAIVAAAAGVTVVKHGNRASSSKCGAADCLEALGLPIDLTPEDVAKVAEETGITFAFAKTFHPSMRHVGPVRAALGVPSVFNVLGPLTNPARPDHLAIGCADREISPLMAEVYAANNQSGMVFTSAEGLDEMAPTGPIDIWEFRHGEVTKKTFDPIEELGLERVTVDDLRGGYPEVNAEAVRDLVAGKDVPFRTTALLNAAAAIVADGHLVPADGSLAERFSVGYKLAEEALNSGKAEQLLNTWIDTARRYKRQEMKAAQHQ
ncbi:anthranilate phosphoribosyltransferase [Bifidobacterium dolichotidis]|uniref:Anthranilate phosphoribosyltransferase n=1 Tax=Bifidobacterium dolichotidis TaxID=2306976 RepID=A0A430FSB4_9BIFI|nr:anthranilate phosphoribosyltransferase [Bifidobacterium dolichotidis]RSX55774.1 anthranilate phosphoribosyltransferase [Bifidobacterium dolichotidis]